MSSPTSAPLKAGGACTSDGDRGHHAPVFGPRGAWPNLAILPQSALQPASDDNPKIARKSFIRDDENQMGIVRGGLIALR